MYNLPSTSNDASVFMNTKQINFDRIFKVTHDLLQIQDLDLLLEQILTAVRKIVNADAGSIYLVEGIQLKFSYTQNDTLQKKLSFGKKLIYATFSMPINNRSIAGYVANNGILVNIADAYVLDDFQPYSFDQTFDEKTGYRTKSILAVPIKTASGDISGVIQLINALRIDRTIRSFTAIEEAIVQLFADNAAVSIEHAQMLRSMITRTNKMVTLRDPTATMGNSNRIAAYTIEIYEAWAHKKGVPEKELQYKRNILRMAAMLYNIGKVAIPSAVLQKPYEKLTPVEQKIYQQHTVYGARLFTDDNSSFAEIAGDIALNHHECWDGSGYPGHVDVVTGQPLPGYEMADSGAIGKRGEEIPIYARIVAVSCAYEREDNKDDVNAILANSGKQFDPDVVAAFISCLEVIRSISTRYQD